MKKRVSSLLLALVLLVSLLPLGTLSAKAAESNAPTISVESVEAFPGSTVTVNVDIKNNPGILGAKLTLSYGEGLTLTEAALPENNAFGALTFTKPGKLVSPCNFVWDGTELNEEDIKDGTILTLTFQVSDGVQEGKTIPVELSYTEGDIIGRDVQPVTIKIKMENGGVKVINYILGDVNRDKVVNPGDLIMLRRHLAGGYDNLNTDTLAADVDKNGVVNVLDLLYIRRHIAGGYTPCPLCPSEHEHPMEATAYKAATCTQNGNIAYWYCKTCDKYFSNEEGTAEITLEKTVIPATGHNYVNGVCSACGVKETKEGKYSVTYNLYKKSDSYLAMQDIKNNPKNPTSFDGDVDIPLYNLEDLPGCEFDGWYYGATDTAEKVKNNIIPAGTARDIELYAHWKYISYKVTFDVYGAPVDKQDPITFTANEGTNLPNPKINNYVFVGWSTDDGTVIDSIPVGMAENVTLHANWTSYRNMTKSIKNLDTPITTCEDTDSGCIYFIYKLGTIEHVPMSDKPFWSINNVQGLSQQLSVTETVSTSTQQADSVLRTIEEATVNSASWTLAENWTDVTSVNKEWSEQHGYSQEEASEKARTSTNSYQLNSFNGGSTYKKTADDTTSVTYGSTNEKDTKGAKLDLNVGAKIGTDRKSSITTKVLTAALGISAEVSGSVDKQTYNENVTEKHTGTDTTNYKSEIDENTSTWNTTETSSSSTALMEKSSVRTAVSDILSQKESVGQSYSRGGEKSNTQEFTNKESKSNQYGNTLTYSNAKETITTKTYTADGKSDGYYRLILAGRVHVYGIVSYDIAKKQFSVNTYSVVDDHREEFLDYSKDGSFTDCENGILPFEIPGYVLDYVEASVANTTGLTFKTNSITGTATVAGYNGDSENVYIPPYISKGGQSYRVTELSESAFKEKQNIKSVTLSKFIKKIPNSAFDGCTSLETVSGYLTEIGDNAFAGCTSLEKFAISKDVISIGTDAFKGVKTISLEVADVNIANAALKSGATHVILDISALDGNITLTVPKISCVEIKGAGKTYNGLKIVSDAEETILDELRISSSTGVPLTIHSDTLVLSKTYVEGTQLALRFSAEEPNLILRFDNGLKGTNGRAVVCKNLKLRDETVENTDATLEVSGNIYAFATTSEVDTMKVFSPMQMLSGEIIKIDEATYDNLMRDAVTVTFDANGGEVLENSKLVDFGTVIGDLPPATRAYYTFDGWYTERDGGTQVMEDQTFSEDTTLYAHWKNGWTAWSDTEPPEDYTGEVETREVYSYRTKSTTTSSSTLGAPWVLYNTTSAWGPYGGWSGWSTSPAYASDSTQVETRTGYYYYYYVCPSCGKHNHGWGTGACYTWAGGCGGSIPESAWHEYYSATPYSSTVDYHGTSRYYVYAEEGLSFCVRDSSNSYYRPPVTQYRYQSHSKVYTYYYYKWSDWSAWTTTEQTASDTREVQSKTQYRYLDAVENQDKPSSSEAEK